MRILESSLALLVSHLSIVVNAQCPNKCSRNGICNNLGICECMPSFTGGDCSIRTCPFGKAFSDVPSGQDTAHNSIPCSGRGACNNGYCECDEGFTGIACERTKCWNNCNNRGKCLSMKYLAETTRNQASQRFSYDQVWDSDKIFGCVCDNGYTGFDCSLRVCPTGDNPLTYNWKPSRDTVASFGTTGHIVLYFAGEPSPNIPADGSIHTLKNAIESIRCIEDVSITYSKGSSLCRDDVMNVVSITFNQNFGPLPPLVPESFGLESWSTVEVAADNSYGMLTDHNYVHYFSVKGDKENDECSNRGLCDQDTGTCKCFDTNGDLYAGSDGYGGVGDRGDSGHAVSVITTCPGDPPCSDKGVCDPVTMRCACENGYSGGDCSLRTCQRGLSWFSYPNASNVAHDTMSECSDMGICHRTTGECFCNDGFFGAACEYMGCARGSEPLKSCSGHGACLSLRELGLLHKQSDGSASPMTYGSDPNSSITWDADRIMGCYCDEGYEGFSCNLRSCPSGIDPLLGGDELYTCSNHGLCNHDTGGCQCFSGWGSSDGSGNLGLLKDCGHRLALRGFP
ncbi:hypothetical protein ACHAW6_002583 [Cyclotella cf. meneghiniana]